jgi:hypothetical protein
MTSRVIVTLLAVCLAGVACGSSPKAPDTGGSSGNVEQISGRERIAWYQQAGTLADAAGLRYAMYVDGAAVPMAAPACQGVSEGLFDCTSPLPQLSAGRHVLELTSANFWSESPRSAPLVVNVTPLSLTAGSMTSALRPNSGAADRPVTCTANGQFCFELHTIADDLRGAIAIRALPDGRVLVQIGDASIVAVEPDGCAMPIAVEQPCRLPLPSRLAALAVSPDFLNDRRLYAAWTCEGGGTARQLLLASYRELGDSLGEARIVEAMTIADPAISIAAGPGSRLFFAAEHESRWTLYSIPRSGSDLGGVPVYEAELNSQSHLASTRERLIVLGNDALSVLLPSGALRWIALDSPANGGARFPPRALAVTRHAIWTAHGTELRAIDAETMVSTSLLVPGDILALDSTAAGDLYALLRVKAGYSVIRLVSQ